MKFLSSMTTPKNSTFFLTKIGKCRFAGEYVL